MPATPTTGAPVVVIGAGPHGLSAAALLRDGGVPTRTFGEPLAFWRRQMPPEMMLRSSPRASSIESPARATKLSHWAAEHGRDVGKIVSIGDFIAYGEWFARRLVPDLDERLVADVRPAGGGRFAVTLADGEELTASRVVVGAGLAPFAYVPALWRDFDAPLVTHTADNVPASSFAGQRVAVIGAGQSALETAAIVFEAGAASVEVLGRTEEIFWLGRWIAPPAAGSASADGAGPVPTVERPPEQTFRARHGLHWRPAPTDVGGRLTSWVGAAPDVVRRLPRPVRVPLTAYCIRPAGAFWLPDRLRSVTITLGVSVTAASRRDGGLALRLDDGSVRLVDRVVLGTGYAVDVRRYPFLSSSLLAGLRTRAGSPVLGRGLESSVPGLHFTGAPAAESFGPVMRFVVGTSYTGPAIAQAVLGRARPRFRWAF